MLANAVASSAATVQITKLFTRKRSKSIVCHMPVNASNVGFSRS